jgi:hypothetical protein
MPRDGSCARLNLPPLKKGLAVAVCVAHLDIRIEGLISCEESTAVNRQDLDARINTHMRVPYLLDGRCLA